jgi:hypothetical protein
MNQLARGVNVALSIDVNSYKYPIKTIEGNSYTVSKANTAGQGKLKIQMSLPPFTYSMSGWMERLSREVLGSIWKRRYFVLCDKKLMYFDKVDEMQSVKKTLDCKDVTSISSHNFKGDPCFCIHIGPESNHQSNHQNDRWTVRFVSDDSPQRIAMWMRKITRSCESIKNDAEKNAFLGPRAMEEALESQRHSEPSRPSGPRRRSIFSH